MMKQLTESDWNYIMGDAKPQLTLEEKIEALRTLIEDQKVEKFYNEYHGTTLTPPQVRTVPGKKYVKIDVSPNSYGHWSGCYMVEVETERVYGIKAYGVIHRGHYYGTLDNMLQMDWSGYRAFKKA